MRINLDGTSRTNPFLRRLSVLQSSIRRAKSTNSATWKKKVFRVNVLKDEHDADFDIPFENDAECEPPEIRHLKNSIVDLNNAFVKSQSALEAVSANFTAQQSVVTQQHSQLSDLRHQNANLRQRLSAVESEADTRAQSNDQLQIRLEELEKEREKQQKGNDAPEILGRKRLHDLGPTQIKATRAAYRKKFLEAINTFGSNRGLELETMILRDKDGERLVINASAPHTFPNLNKAEKKRVTQTSIWKDLNRIADQVYSSIAQLGSLPPASHINQHEQILNLSLPELLEVI